MSNWHTEPLQNVISYITKGIAPAYVDVEDENTVSVLNQKCNRDFAISYADSRLHDLSKRSIPQEKYLRDNDILINSTGTGTAGRIAQLNNVPHPTIVDGHMIIIRGNEKVVPRYLGYALKAQQALVLQLDEGSTGQTELNRDRLLSEIEISYPVSLYEQEAIAATLSALDALIAENRAINNHLTSPRSATDSSPDISFGIRASRVSIMRAFSTRLCRIASNIGSITLLKSVTTLILGTRIRYFLKSGTVSCCCVVPTPAI
jgi:type I restriction enzyme S subunit